MSGRAFAFFPKLFHCAYLQRSFYQSFLFCTLQFDIMKDVFASALVLASADLKSAVAAQPVSIATQADQSSFQSYKSCVLSSGCGTQLDHRSRIRI